MIGSRTCPAWQSYLLGGLMLVLAVVALVIEFTWFPIPAALGLLLLVAGIGYLWSGHNEVRIRRLEQVIHELTGRTNEESSDPRAAAEPAAERPADD